MKKLLSLVIGIGISITIHAQLQNLDFENWDNPITTDYSSNIPTGWNWTNGTIITPANPFYYPPSIKAQHNNYALYLSVWYDYTKDAAFQKAAISERPVSLSGWYDYKHNIIGSPSGFSQPDTARISVFVTKYNHTSNTIDTIGKGFLEIGDSTADYTAFSINIEYFSTETPDSITVFLDPSLVKRYGPGYQVYGNQHLGGHTSFFWVDNLQLNSGTTGINNVKSDNRISVYPNPAKDYIHLGEISGFVTIWDISGRKIENISQQSSNKIDVSRLNTGTYFLLIDNGKSQFRAKFMKP